MRCVRSAAVAAFAGLLGSMAVAAGPAELPLAESAEAGVGAMRVAPPATRITMGFTGDLHTLRAVNQQARRSDGSYDYRPMFAAVAPLLSWFDVAVCHLENPMAPPGAPVIVEPPLLSSAPSLAVAVAQAGFDRCSAASNHALDRGVAGVRATLDALDAAGVGHSGMARTEAEATPALFEVEGVAIAHLSYTFSVIGWAPDTWTVNVIDATAIIAAARDARSRGARIVVVSLHWGTDKQIQPTAYQRSVADAVTRAGVVDVIVGHQAHVLQPIEQVNGTWVVWGLGNFLSNHPVSAAWPAESQDAAVVGVEFFVTEDRVDVGRPWVHPTWIDRTGGHVIRPTTQSSDLGLALWVRRALAESRERTRAIVGDYFAPGQG